MSWLGGIALVVAGIGAGSLNAVLGSGSLISFPTLIALGYPPVLANVSNNIGLVPGAIGTAVGFRSELRGQGRRVATLAVASGAGALAGAGLLLTLPPGVFDAVVPALVLLACVLMVLQPRLSRWVAGRRRADAREVGAAPMAIALGAGIYGGYFGAAQGVILLVMLAVFVPDDIHRLNALKGVLAGIVNGLAALVFIAVAEVAWDAVALVGAGALVGGTIGSRFARRLSATTLRALVVVLGIGVSLRLFMT